MPARIYYNLKLYLNFGYKLISTTVKQLSYFQLRLITEMEQKPVLQLLYRHILSPDPEATTRSHVTSTNAHENIMIMLFGFALHIKHQL